MKRIVLACFLLTATCTATFVQTATAQTAAITVTATDFTAKVNQMDAQLASGDLTAAQATWATLNNMMKAELGVSKNKIVIATTDADKATALTANRTQSTTYREIWALKTDLAANRTAIHAKLLTFAGTI